MIGATHPQVYAYWREDQQQKLLIILNFSSKRVEFRPEVKEEQLKVLLGNYGDNPVWDKTLELRPYEALIFGITD